MSDIFNREESPRIQSVEDCKVIRYGESRGLHCGMKDEHGYCSLFHGACPAKEFEQVVYANGGKELFRVPITTPYKEIIAQLEKDRIAFSDVKVQVELKDTRMPPKTKLAHDTEDDELPAEELEEEDEE